MKKFVPILLICLVSVSLVTAFSLEESMENFFSLNLNDWLTGFFVQQYDAQCIEKEKDITINTLQTKELTVSMLNTGKKWKKHEAGINLKTYGLSVEESMLETKEIIKTNEQSDFTFSITPSFSGSKEADLTIEYQMERIKGLATKYNKNRRFGEICYINLHVIEGPVELLEKKTPEKKEQPVCIKDNLCDRTKEETEENCPSDCFLGKNIKFKVKEGQNIISLGLGYNLKLFEIDTSQFAHIGAYKLGMNLKPTPIFQGQTKVVENIDITNLEVIGKEATILLNPIKYQ